MLFVLERQMKNTVFMILKRRFGGELVNFGRYKKIHSPKKLWLAEKGFEIYRRLKL